MIKREENRLIIPPNIDLIFEDDCMDCPLCEPVVIESDKRYRIGCNIVAICKKAKSMATQKRTKEFPYV